MRKLWKLLKMMLVLINTSSSQLLHIVYLFTSLLLAPEIAVGCGYSFQCDWWSLGILIVAMAMGKVRNWLCMEICDRKSFWDIFCLKWQLLVLSINRVHSWEYCLPQNTTQKMKFSMKDFFSKCDQNRSFLRIWSHLLEKPFMKNCNFCVL